MEKIKELLFSFLKDRKVMFYVGLGAAVLSILSGIIYIAALSSISDYTKIYIVFLPIIGALAFLVAALFRQTRIGAVLMTIFDFAALLCYIGTIYDYPLTQMMTVSNIFEIPHFGAIIVVAVFFLLATILSNVIAWSPLDKKAEQEIKE